MTQSDAQHEQHPRSIKSFVLRQGHMTPAQQRAIDENWPRFGLDFQHAPVDLNAAFGREAPKILEIGFGMGTATAEIAKRLPEIPVGFQVAFPISGMYKTFKRFVRPQRHRQPYGCVRQCSPWVWPDR